MKALSAILPAKASGLLASAVVVVGALSAAQPSHAQATVKATLWTTLNGNLGSMTAGQIIKWEFDITNVASLFADSAQTFWLDPSKPNVNLTGTVYNSALTTQVAVFGGTFNAASDGNAFGVVAGNGTDYATSGSDSVFILDFSAPAGGNGLIIPGTSAAINTLTFGLLNEWRMPYAWQAVNPPSISDFAAQNIIDNGYINTTLFPVNPVGNSIGQLAATSEGTVTLNVNSIRLSVPGPLPLLGVGSAFAYSRKIRCRIRRVKVFQQEQG